MIADRAGIARQTIYKKHFINKEDLINTIHCIIDEPCKKKIEKFVLQDKSDFITFFAYEILPLLYLKKDWLKILYGTTVDLNWIDFLKNRYSPIFQKYLTNSTKDTNLPLEFFSNMILYQIISVVSSWMTSEIPEPPSIFSKKFINILSKSTAELLVNK